MERISTHITYAEATYSDTAIRHGLDNEPNSVELLRMQLVAQNCFEPAREHFQVPLRVNSFFRSRDVNDLIKGSSKTSQHVEGEAIDMSAMPGTGLSNRELFDWLAANVEFDQLIWEYGDDRNPAWVHISWVGDRTNRRQVLIKRQGEPYKPFPLPI